MKECDSCKYYDYYDYYDTDDIFRVFPYCSINHEIDLFSFDTGKYVCEKYEKE